MGTDKSGVKDSGFWQLTRGDEPIAGGVLADEPPQDDGQRSQQ